MGNNYQCDIVLQAVTKISGIDAFQRGAVCCEAL